MSQFIIIALFAPEDPQTRYIQLERNRKFATRRDAEDFIRAQIPADRKAVVAEVPNMADAAVPPWTIEDFRVTSADESGRKSADQGRAA